MSTTPGTATTTGGTVSASRLLAVIVPSMLLMVITADMVNLLLPAMGEQFGASEAQLAWVVTGFLLVFAVGIPFYGRIADRVDPRRMFCLALLVFAVGSLISALAPGLGVLVLGRAVMGAGAAAIPVLAIVAVTRELPAHQRGTAIGFIGAAAGVGTAAGPPVGGVLGQLLGWPALFWLTLVWALALVPAVRRVFPGGAPGYGRPFDTLGGVFLGLAAGLGLFGVTQAQEAGFAAPSSWGALLAAAVAAALFVWRTFRARHPFVPPSLFANRVYAAAVGIIFLTLSANLAVLVFVPVMVVGVHGLTPGEGSLVMIPGGLAVAVLSPVAGRLIVRAGARNLVTAGLAAMGASALMLSATAGASPVWAAAGVLGVGAGFAVVITVITDTAAGALPPQDVGVGTGIFQGAQFLGAGAGPALAGALLVARQSTEQAVSPWYALGAPAYSDVFLAATAAAAVAVALAWRLPRAAARREAEPRTP